MSKMGGWKGNCGERWNQYGLEYRVGWSLRGGGDWGFFGIHFVGIDIGLWICLLDSVYPNEGLLYAHLYFGIIALTFLQKYANPTFSLPSQIYWISSWLTEKQEDLSFCKLAMTKENVFNCLPWNLKYPPLILGLQNVQVPSLPSYTR